MTSEPPCCLNRTSVGLKAIHLRLSAIRGLRLNRTSVGLKECWSANDNPSPGKGLNRTSVGLKGSGGLIWRLATLSPQSNQRGIESSADGFTCWGEREASIEPAWD